MLLIDGQAAQVLNLKPAQQTVLMVLEPAYLRLYDRPDPDGQSAPCGM